MLPIMPTLKSSLGDWHVESLHNWSERALVIQAPDDTIIGPSTKVATVGSCFASELARSMGKVGIVGGMHPGGLYYSTATIRQELERLAGGWPERAQEPNWRVEGGWVDPFRDYRTAYPDEETLLRQRAEADAEADALFEGAGVVVATLGLIETWRSRQTGNTYRQIPHPGAFPTLDVAFHRLSVTEMLEDLERIRRVVVERLGAKLLLTTSPVPLHTTFTDLDVRVANMESKSRIRAAVSEFVERHRDVRYFHSYEMVVTTERQSDYFREDGRHVHRHAVDYIVSEFLRIFGDPALHMTDVDSSWLTAIDKTAPTVQAQPASQKPPRPPVSFPRRVARKVRREVMTALGRA
jgi:GSCFA family protein